MVSNCSFKEANETRATLREVRVDTFALFCQFAYAGDYDVPLSTSVTENAASSFHENAEGPSGVSTRRNTARNRPHDSGTTGPFATDSINESPIPETAAEEFPEEVPLVEEVPPLDEPGPEAEPTEDLVDEWGRSYRSTKSKRKSKKFKYESLKPFQYEISSFSAPQRGSFGSVDYPIPEIRTTLFARCDPIPNSNPEQDYSGVFLGHARLYVFARMSAVDSLEKLAIHKLYKTLREFKLYEERIPDVLRLVRYLYAKSMDESEADRELDRGELFNLVLSYVVKQVDTIEKDEEFREMLEQGGEFVLDLWEKMKLRRT